MRCTSYLLRGVQSGGRYFLNFFQFSILISLVQRVPNIYLYFLRPQGVLRSQLWGQLLERLRMFLRYLKSNELQACFSIIQQLTIVMSEKVEQPEPRPTTPNVEMKYKYLTDLSRQDSPNLRKQYQENYQRYSSSQNGSKDYQKGLNNHYRVYKYQRHYSPSCNTFNPKRQFSEFSPYEEKVQDFKEQVLAKQLAQQNSLLKEQLKESSSIIEKLRYENQMRCIDIQKLKKKEHNDLIYYEKIVGEMKNQIQLVLTKNKMLEDQVVSVKARAHEENRRLSVHLMERMPIERSPLERASFNRSPVNRPCQMDKSAYKSKRSVGKLMNKTTIAMMRNGEKSKQDSKIKIEESEFDEQMDKTRPNCPLDKENKSKTDDLLSSIRLMFFKIEGQQVKGLKELWKWLKNIAYTHSCLRKWKKKVAKSKEPSNLVGNEKLLEYLEEGIGYIE